MLGDNKVIEVLLLKLKVWRFEGVKSSAWDVLVTVFVV